MPVEAEDLAEVVVQVNGKVRERLMLPAAAPEAEALDGAAPKKVIYVPGRLVNVVR